MAGSMQSLRGIFPKAPNPPKRNFIRENVISLKPPKNKQTNNRNEASQGKFKGARISRSTSSTRVASESEASISSKKFMKNELDNQKKSRPLSVRSRDACSQTETVDGELFLKDVIIRLPSAGLWKSENNVMELYKKTDNVNIDENVKDAIDTETSHVVDSGRAAFAIDAKGVGFPIETIESDSQSNLMNDDNKSISSPLSPRIENRIALPYATDNSYTAIPPSKSTSISSRLSSRIDKRITLPYATDNSYTAIPSSYRYGELPNYLRQMKIKSTENARLSALIDPDCPPNHTVLSDSERLATLRIAQLKTRELIDELNRLPMTSSTLRVRDRRVAIENELRKLDSTTDLFSRSKVYVRNDKIALN